MAPFRRAPIRPLAMVDSFAPAAFNAAAQQKEAAGPAPLPLATRNRSMARNGYSAGHADHPASHDDRSGPRSELYERSQCLHVRGTGADRRLPGDQRGNARVLAEPS